MNIQCSFNKHGACISTLQQRPGVITELVLAFVGRGFGNNTHSMQTMEKNVLQCIKTSVGCPKVCLSHRTLNTSQNPNVSEVLQFPAIVRIFTPILFVERLVGLVSNILLLTLLAKARSFQNGVNIYLCSMAVNNLMCLFPVSTSLVLSVTKQWVLGQTMCTLNQVHEYVLCPTLCCTCSRERYRAVLHLFEWKPYSRRTHLELGVMWTVAVVMGVLGVLQGS